MTTLSRVALLLALLMAVAGCRQPDGPMPEATEEALNRTDDISRDLLSVAGGDPQAPMELAEDLSVFTIGEEGVAAAGELAAVVSVAVEGLDLAEERALQIANSLWLVVAARELSEGQMTAVRDGLRSDLVAAGADEVSAEAAAVEAGETQASVSTRPRRWYEIF
jgi:hypothetical protein